MSAEDELRREIATLRARFAALGALVETSPVGAVVFDATAGRAVSFNREARRLVESFHPPARLPDRSPAELLPVLTVRRGDGREFALAEYPLAEALANGETVRAEEIEPSTPYGRSVTTLVNATPIRSRDGSVGSMVVTLQDLAPLEALDRRRSEFLGMVSHEPRTPLAVDNQLEPARIAPPALRSGSTVDRIPRACLSHSTAMMGSRRPLFRGPARAPDTHRPIHNQREARGEGRHVLALDRDRARDAGVGEGREGPNRMNGPLPGS